MNNILERNIIEYLNNSALNYITKEQAIDKDCIGIKIYENPIFAYGEPGDELFLKLKHEVIGMHHRLPLEWNEKAKTVVSMFFPFTKEVVKSNGINYDFPSNLWLHGRIEGQACLNDLGKYIVEMLTKKGHTTICPIVDEKFMSVGRDTSCPINFTSNWSERHVGYICGLGTFGLSKGLITEKGMAGRLLSVITECDFEKTARKYTEIYEYCTMCGVCGSRCPGNAITIEDGKNHILCADFCDYVKRTAKPRYGCGKCQMNCPCTDKIPNISR